MAPAVRVAQMDGSQLCIQHLGCFRIVLLSLTQPGHFACKGMPVPETPGSHGISRTLSVQKPTQHSAPKDTRCLLQTPGKGIGLSSHSTGETRHTLRSLLPGNSKGSLAPLADQRMPFIPHPVLGISMPHLETVLAFIQCQHGRYL